MMWNVWSFIAAALLGIHRDVTAQQNVRCWPLCPCVTNLGEVRGQDHTNNEQTQSVDGII